MNPISNIEATINTSKKSLISFTPDKLSYDLEVPEDCFGVLLRLKYESEFYISIKADKDAGRFGFPELDPAMGDYIAGSEIPYYEYYDGYILRLDKREACFDEDLHVNVTIDAGSYEHGQFRYELHLTRKSNKKTRDLFKEGSFFDDEYGISMPYELYVPTDYDPKKKYPIIVGLHGTGEIQEPISAVLKKMQMATIWAEDSEKGRNQCLVLAPQCTIRYNDEDNWTSLNQFIKGHSNSPFWPMPHLIVLWRLMEELFKKYSIDKDRLYLTGVSSGTFGVYAMAMEHPRTFAGMIVACGAANPARIEDLRGLPMWIFHSDDDPLIVPEFTLEPTLKALDNAGIEYKLTRYPKGQVFWQSAHFCWEVLYKDKEVRDWLFSQSLKGAVENRSEKSGGNGSSGQSAAAKPDAAAGQSSAGKAGAAAEQSSAEKSGKASGQSTAGKTDAVAGQSTDAKPQTVTGHHLDEKGRAVAAQAIKAAQSSANGKKPAY